MLTIIGHWNAIMEAQVSFLNREIADIARAGSEKSDVAIFEYLVNARHRLAAFTFYRDWLVKEIEVRPSVEEAKAQIIALLDRDILRALQNLQMHGAYKVALADMRKSADLPMMWREDRVTA